MRETTLHFAKMVTDWQWINICNYWRYAMFNRDFVLQNALVRDSSLGHPFRIAATGLVTTQIVGVAVTIVAIAG
jgi:hypothetical protein